MLAYNSIHKAVNKISVFSVSRHSSAHTSSMAADAVEYTIGGVKINFPCKAYPSQLAMMNSVSVMMH